jgi:NAD(P)-dependent dehydrogenase (short-subunit alcohol dehydrogenase family)
LPTGVTLTEQIAIVTGSNAGLGLEASRHLLKLGLARLIMGVRSAAKGEKAAATLRAEFPKSTVSVWLLDMESYDSIHAFVDQCAALPRLDVVVLNAGLGASKHALVPGTGHETTMQVNYLSTALLAVLLLSILKKQESKRADGRPPTLTVVSSDVVYTSQIKPTAGTSQLKQFDDPDTYSAFQRYGISKLALLLFTCKLAEIVDPNQVLINSVNPGMTTGTNFFNAEPWIVRKIVGLIQAALARPTDVGATNYLDAILSYGAKSHGSFVSDWQIKP